MPSELRLKMIVEPKQYEPVPSWAADYPNVAQTVKQTRLTFYCINCQTKRPTRFITPNFGPVCEACEKELR
jgi:hypothetical protein